MKWVKFGVSGHFPEIAWRKWPQILHTDVSWAPSELISSWPQSDDFLNFCAILTYWNGSNLGFPVISQRMHGGNGLKLCLLMYLDHLQKWLVLGHGLLTFVILALFWLSETGQIWGFRAFPGECMEGMAWNMVCCCILTTSRTDSIMVTVWWFLAATKQLYEWYFLSVCPSVCPSVRLSHLFDYVPHLGPG